MNDLIPAGYMYKLVEPRPDWLKAAHVEDSYSVGSCSVEDFIDWFQLWKHNGYWLFDNVDVMHGLARDHNVDLERFTPFFYRIFPSQWDVYKKQWCSFHPMPDIETIVEIPNAPRVVGFDVVTYTCETNAECSLLFCYGFAENLATNEHCLFETLEDAKNAIEGRCFEEDKHGPYRIVEVNSL